MKLVAVIAEMVNSGAAEGTGWDMEITDKRRK